jgi:hypothetical protein
MMLFLKPGTSVPVSAYEAHDLTYMWARFAQSEETLDYWQISKAPG